MGSEFRLSSPEPNSEQNRVPYTTNRFAVAAHAATIRVQGGIPYCYFLTALR